MHVFSKLKETLTQFSRPKFIYTLLCKSTSVMPELTTQSKERSKTLAKQDQEQVELTFFSPLFAFSVLVHLRTVSLLHRILSRIMCAIQAQHFEPLPYSTVYGPKIRELFTLYV